MNVGKAYQRLVRDKQQQSGLDDHLLENVNTDISNAIVRPVSYSEAKRIIEEYEWLGCMPAIALYMFGIFYDDLCAGVVIFSPDYIENLGHWDKYDYTGKMLLLSRGACVYWAHPHSGSKLIMESIKQLPDKYKVITATIDPNAGEIGTIYQACNFYYIGSMRENNPNINFRDKDRFGVIINNKLYGPRAMRQKVGSQKKEDVLQKYPNAIFVPQYNKHRYFLFRGTKKEKKYYKSKIAEHIKPYPKRNDFSKDTYNSELFEFIWKNNIKVQTQRFF